MIHWLWGRPRFLGKFLDRRLDVARRHLPGIQRERDARPGNGGELVLVHIDRDHDASEGCCDLDGIAADAADPVDDDKIALLDAGLHDRLIGRGHRIGDHRKISQFDSDSCQAVFIDDTKSARRHGDMGGEAAMNIVARHLLVRADRRLAAEASIASAARDHRRNNDRPVGVPKSIRAGVDDMAADLMPERQRQLMLGAHTVIVVAKVGMADPAAGDFDHDFIGGRSVPSRIPSEPEACPRPSSSSESAWRSSVCPPVWPLSPSPERAALFVIL